MVVTFLDLDKSELPRQLARRCAAVFSRHNFVVLAQVKNTLKQQNVVR